MCLKIKRKLQNNYFNPAKSDDGKEGSLYEDQKQAKLIYELFFAGY